MCRYKTETLLAIPLRSARSDGLPLGVLVATNKKHGIFSLTVRGPLHGILVLFWSNKTKPADWQDEDCFASFASALGLCVWAVLGHDSALQSVWRHQQALQAVHSLQSHARDTSTLVSLLPVVRRSSTSKEAQPALCRDEKH
jgi:hypothetical protein